MDSSNALTEANIVDWLTCYMKQNGGQVEAFVTNYLYSDWIVALHSLLQEESWDTLYQLLVKVEPGRMWGFMSKEVTGYEKNILATMILVARDKPLIEKFLHSRYSHKTQEIVDRIFLNYLHELNRNHLKEILVLFLVLDGILHKKGLKVVLKQEFSGRGNIVQQLPSFTDAEITTAVRQFCP